MSFFKEHQKILEKNYPGINEYILTRELGDLDLNSIKEDLLAGKPLSYITKNKYFVNRDFYIDERVLIPRYETEILVELALSELKNNPEARVLDLCCGSGNVGLSLFEELSGKMDLTLSDLSEDAIQVAKMNAKDLKVNIIQSDLLTHIDQSFDLIVSNPPYISVIHQGGVHEKVDQFEPALALYIAEEKYSKWFEALFNDVYQHLNDNGVFIMEGHEDKLQAQIQQMESTGFIDVKTFKDLTGRLRFIKGRKK